MASPGSPDASAAARKHLRVLLPFSLDTLRIPDELAEEVGAGEAHLVVPFGTGKVRRVEVGRDGDGAFVGRGWPEFAAACGAGAGWLLLLRHHGGGVLSVKAFDDSCCLTTLARGPPDVAAAARNKDPSRRPQFISFLPHGFTEKMEVPTEFVQHCIPKEHLDNRIAVVFGPLGKKFQIELERNQSGVFFAAGWSQFLEFHGISESDILRFRYEGNMMFTAKVFEPEGCQRDSTQQVVRMQQIIEKKDDTPSAFIPKSKNYSLVSEGRPKKPKASKSSLKKASLGRRSLYEIGPSSWIMKVINSSTLENHLALSKAFCDAIGLQNPCTITLKTSMECSRFWQVQGVGYYNSSYMIRQGWRMFCLENSLKEGDVCTFNVIKTTLWHVVIVRFKGNHKDKGKKKDGSHSEEQTGTNCFKTSMNKSSFAKKCFFNIGPPAWIKKTMNTCTIKNQFSLPLAFCMGIGLREPCRITLETSTSTSTMSWHARVVPYKYCSHIRGSGWKRFCLENHLKEGDVCTFNVIQTTLWHVIIVRL